MRTYFRIRSVPWNARPSRDPEGAVALGEGMMSKSEQIYTGGQKKMRDRSLLGGLILSLFYKDTLSSALSLILAGAVLIYTIPAPLSAQLPQLPIPIKPPAAKPAGGGGGAEGGQPPPAAAPAPQEVQPPQPIAAGQGTMPLPDDQPPFHILVIEGEGAINNIHQTVNRACTVLVEDENKTPLSGVAVSFFLPADGPSGLFPNGSRVLTVFTDEKGLATSRPVRFSPLVGIMPIRVTASLFSQSVNATIMQTNVASGQAVRSYVSPITRNQEPAGHGIHVPKKVWVTAIIVGAGVTAGVILLNRTTPPNATIGGGTTTGPIVVGAPH
jgi:hypothetical protein